MVTAVALWTIVTLLISLIHMLLKWKRIHAGYTTKIMPFWPQCCETEGILSKTFRFGYAGCSVHMGKIFITVTEISSQKPRSRFFSGFLFYKERVARQDLGNLASPVDRAHILNYEGALKISKPFKRTTCLGPLRPRLHWKRMILAEGSSSLHVMALCIVYVSYELIYIPF